MIHTRPSQLAVLFPDKFPTIESTGLTDGEWERAGGHAFVPPRSEGKP